MDEISTLRDSFDPAVPTEAAEQRARAALQARMASAAPRISRRPRLRLPITVGSSVMAAAVVAAFAVASLDRPGNDARPPGVPSISAPAAKAAAPYLRPVSAAQILENAAWSAEQEKWVDPTPQQFMYVETLEMRNQPAEQQKHPNGILLPGKAKYEKFQRWDRIDGQVMASIRNGKLVIEKQGDGGGYWTRLDWSKIDGLTTPQKISAWVANPGPVGMDVDAMAGQYVLPPAVKAAIFRYLAEQPGMKVNPDAVNIDGRPAIGLGRIEEGYLAQELLFDKQTYALVGERLIAIRDHTSHALDGDTKIHKGDVLRQVVYGKMLIVDRPGDTV
jgi:hypothetical protein